MVEGKEKRTGTELAQEITKKQKVKDDKETTKIKKLMEIIPDKEEVAIDAIPLAVKSPTEVSAAHELQRKYAKYLLLLVQNFHPFPNTPLNSPAPSLTTTDETNHSNPTPNIPQSPLTSPSTSTNTTTTSRILTESSQPSPSIQQEQHQTESSPSQTEPSPEPSSTQTTTPPPSNPPPQPRHSTRQHTIPLKHLINIINNAVEPQSYTQAVKDVRWVDAMSKELHALEANNTWTITSLPPNKTPIGSKWGFRIKCNSDGSIERLKGRLVAKGFNQKEGIYYNETFPPVVKMLDINNAFLHGDLHEEVYMTLPQGYKPPTSIPTPVYADTSLLTYKKNADFLALVIYIDYILLAGNNTTLINHIKQQLDSKFNIKDLGNLNYYLGIEFQRNKTGITMTQRKYALELLHTAGILDVKPSHIPIDPNIKLNDIDGDPLPDASLYRTLVGKLLYLTITRPDLSYVAHCLSQFSHSPRTPHFDALIKVLIYIKLCLGQGLYFPTYSSLQLKAYCDSDWANCPTTRRNGYLRKGRKTKPKRQNGTEEK
ncbi:RmlC-like cupins superfamily protein [Tanacetum coccineum]